MFVSDMIISDRTWFYQAADKQDLVPITYICKEQVKLYMKPYEFQALKDIETEANDAKNIDYLFRLPPPLFAFNSAC